MCFISLAGQTFCVGVLRNKNVWPRETLVFYAAPGVPRLGDSSDKSRGVYLRGAFMTAFVARSIVYPEAITRGRLL